MFRNIAQLYSLIVCLVLTLASVVFIILLTLRMIDLNFFEFRYHNALSDFKDIKSYNSSYIFDKHKQYSKSLSDEQLIKFIDDEKSNYINSEKIKLKNALIDYITYLIVISIFMIIHIRIYKMSS